MASLIRSVSPRDPLSELFRMGGWMDSMFEPMVTHPSARLLPLDVFTDDSGLVVEAALPGVAPGDVKLTVEDSVLTIEVAAGSPNEVADADYRLREVFRGSRKRALRLPKNVEGVAAKASFTHGLLRVHLPLRAESRAVQIPLLADTEASA